MTLALGVLLGVAFLFVIRTRKRAAIRSDLTAGIAGAQPMEWDGPGRFRGSPTVRRLPAPSGKGKSIHNGQQ